jgi:hypothetical protein
MIEEFAGGGHDSLLAWFLRPSYFFSARVRAAFLAALDFSVRFRWRAAERVCFESDSLEAASWPSRLSARVVARERFGEDDLSLPSCVRSYSR